MRPNRTLVIPLLLIFRAALALTCLGQDTNCISVRVLNSKNGNPVKGVQVTFEYNMGKGKVNVEKTNKWGTASDCISGPVPETFRLAFYEFDGPVEGGVFRTEAVMTQGVVESYSSQGTKFKFTENPKPGEVVVFGQRWCFIDRWLGPWP
jgi:hypothetical protein